MSISSEPVVVVGGGQSGLASARALRDAGLRPVVLEAGARPVGSWPRYYDSLTLLSPVRYSTMPGLAMPGDPDSYPVRDEVVDYLQRYAEGLSVEIRVNTRVEAVESRGRGFTVRTTDGEVISAAGVVAASGAFGTPYTPFLPGRETFSGRVLHVADYRNPKPYVGERVVVVGAGNSAVQVGHELSDVASVTLATRHPVRFLAREAHGQDVRAGVTTSRFDDLPPAWLAHVVSSTLALDLDGYRAAWESGRWDQRPMFTGFETDSVVWPDGTEEHVDTVIFATGYRPSLSYLAALGALDPGGFPLHTCGLSDTTPGLVYAGLEFQRSFASNTLRGVAHDVHHVLPPLAAHVRNAAAAVGL